MDILKILIGGLGVGCTLTGTVIALVGLYFDILSVAIIGLALIGVGIIIMEFLYKKLFAL